MDYVAPSSRVPSMPKLTSRGIREFRDDRLGLLRRFNSECGDIGELQGITNRVICVNSPELVHELLVEKSRSFEKSPVLRLVLNPLAGQGLFTSEGELWRKQ